MEKISPLLRGWQIPKFPKFHYFDVFLLNKKLVIRKLSTNTGFSTILHSTNTRFYCTSIKATLYYSNEVVYGILSESVDSIWNKKNQRENTIKTTYFARRKAGEILFYKIFVEKQVNLILFSLQEKFCSISNLR